VAEKFMSNPGMRFRGQGQPDEGEMLRIKKGAENQHLSKISMFY